MLVSKILEAIAQGMFHCPGWDTDGQDRTLTEMSGHWRTGPDTDGDIEVMEEHITMQSDTSTGYTVFWINMDAINIELMMKTMYMDF